MDSYMTLYEETLIPRESRTLEYKEVINPLKSAEFKEAIALRVGKSFITECWWKILPSVASLAVWGVHRFRMATRV